MHARRIAQARFDAETAEGEAPSWSPDAREYDLHAELLREIRESMVAVLEAVVTSAGGRARKVKPLPTPTTLVDAALEEIRGEWVSDVLSRYGFRPTRPEGR